MSTQIVFTNCFSYLRQQAIDFLKNFEHNERDYKITCYAREQFAQVSHKEYAVCFDEIQWILTIPAIWNEQAKESIRCWASESGMTTSNDLAQLKIVLEPECASLYFQEECRLRQLRNSNNNSSNQQKSVANKSEISFDILYILHTYVCYTEDYSFVLCVNANIF
jgi:hypothetical protein